jgi:predicted nucleic acid-binding protein
VEATLAFHKSILRYPLLRRAAPGWRHSALLYEFIEVLSLAGNDINDAWLAALAIEQGATLVSLDRGFARFPGLSWFQPSFVVR